MVSAVQYGGRITDVEDGIMFDTYADEFLSGDKIFLSSFTFGQGAEG